MQVCKAWCSGPLFWHWASELLVRVCSQQAVWSAAILSVPLWPVVGSLCSPYFVPTIILWASVGVVCSCSGCVVPCTLYTIAALEAVFCKGVSFEHTEFGVSRCMASGCRYTVVWCHHKGERAVVKTVPLGECASALAVKAFCNSGSS